MNSLKDLTVGHMLKASALLGDKVEKCDHGCWHWKGEKNRNGYGRIRIGKRRVGAHRISFILTYGGIGPGLVLDHLCRNRSCVNPFHLEPVTVRENTLRGDAVLFK